MLNDMPSLNSQKKVNQKIILESAQFGISRFYFAITKRKFLEKTRISE